ncbi:hypothetical protein [Mycobacterium sp. Aquia_213]|uniref:hypothetical protein n=1 Tax=Mycobacterium sp. Aquia_213 TaxID=2991728 RepID=UPI0022715B98|nr:hypothetical protein [Mycobacterium sp. Aquia_213]WAC90188.1 hypothetical protein LMQ14_19970 [Mycobacterium sp. Aquia_213]
MTSHYEERTTIVDPVARDATTSFESESSGPVFQAPFEGWLAFADIVADSNPALSDLMAASAYLARSVLEEQMPLYVDRLGALLDMSPSAIDSLRVALAADTLPLTPQALADVVQDAVAEAAEADAELFTNERNYVDTAARSFIDSGRTSERSANIYDQTLKWLKEKAKPGSSFHWRASCSLERPSALGGRKPIYCARVAHPYLFGDHVGALEATYGHKLFVGFEGNAQRPGQVGAGGGYRATIDDEHPSYYWDSLSSPTGAWAFTLHLMEGPRVRLASKIAARVEAKQEQINDLIGEQVDNSRNRIEELVGRAVNSLPSDALAATALSAVVHPLVALIALGAKAMFKLVVARLIKVFKEVNLTTWTVWHTTITDSGRVPISIFTLARPGRRTPGLCRLKSEPTGAVADDDYQYDPNLQRQARFMIGPTSLGTDTFSENYFKLVADKGQPLAWQEPFETNSGFRILVPHTAPGSKASYVCAIRADVLPSFTWEL